MKQIEEYITQYKGKTFSSSEDALDYWRDALKQNTEQVINAMLVEEREEGQLKNGKSSYGSHKLGKRIGFNQCCALQKELKAKLINPKGEVKSD